MIGRVARRIWAKAMQAQVRRQRALARSSSTTSRPRAARLHAQEIAFNDIRTTLQALYALYDNCNSLHTNAYDEAITTPTEESVRRALAIQLIINKELGLAKNENPLQGSFIIEELTDLVEEAVLARVRAHLRARRRARRDGAHVPAHARSRKSRSTTRRLKHSGELPIVGVNTFLGEGGSPTIVPDEVIRATEEEKHYAIESLRAFQARNADQAPGALAGLQTVALEYDNLFESLMEVSKVCSLGQISGALYEVGGQYRRNM